MAISESLAVDIQNLGFRYPGNAEAAFSGFNLQIGRCERFGLFGPNGAGKTTLMSLMTGLIKAQEGNIHILGNDVSERSIKKKFGFVPQDFSFYQELSPKENLQFFGAWAGLTSNKIKQRMDELLQVLGLEDVCDKPVGKFSGGMKRRVNLAIGVIHEPALLFLDEPTVGVDVQTRHAIISYLTDLNNRGTTLVYTSHQLSEAEGLCQRIALMEGGDIIAKGDLDELFKEHRATSLEELFLDLTGKDYKD
ncbi:MAG TPA: ABC transporter ATP-binding protein [Mucilaginibacter sp.]|nr:ABC transporter ATP-binding protein [Mucilaginibacter sp.]